MDKILQQCIAKILDECKKCETQEQLEEYIINPLITYIGNKLWPYISSMQIHQSPMKSHGFFDILWANFVVYIYI